MNIWQPINTAPLDNTRILLTTAEEENSTHVGYWDAYYAEGGSGFGGGNGWVIDAGEEYRLHHNGPTHWMPTPPPIESTDDGGCKCGYGCPDGFGCRHRDKPDDRLWALHMLGPDDVHAAPSYAAAETARAWYAERFKDHPELSFAVIRWPHSTTGHINSLREWDEVLPIPPRSPAADEAKHG